MDRTGMVAVVNRKGGSGKSTTTLNLAGALAERGPLWSTSIPSHP